MSTPSPAIAIIPARLASTRFPNKVLADKTGRPLIQHVWEAARKARSLSRVVVAVDDARVRDAVTRFGGEAVMTRADHPNGTSRLCEASQALGLDGDDIVVNLQGDEPELDAAVIDAGVELARRSAAPVITIASPFQAGEDPSNPNVVKVVLKRDGTALYFSRSLIPHPRVGSTTPAAPLKHIGLYVYRAGFLPAYVALAPAPLEQTEMLEQLRVLEHGHAIAVAIRHVSSQGIDTPEQYEEFVRRFNARR